MAALYTTRAVLSYTTAWDAILRCSSLLDAAGVSGFETLLRSSVRFTGSVATVPLFGIAAALLAHQTLLALATAHIAAPSYASHAHASVGSTLVVELLLVLAFATAGVREALRRDQCRVRRPVARPSMIATAAGITACAIVTLFCMEYSESGSAALGLGWIGDQACPGIAILAGAVGSAIAAYAAGACGQLEAFDRLVAFFFALLTAVASVARRSAAVRPCAPLPLRRDPPSARHAGLRAPPIPTT